MSKPFKRYYTKPEHTAVGKGDWRRDAQVSEQEAAINHCRIFGHKMRYGFCTCCGQQEVPCP